METHYRRGGEFLQGADTPSHVGEAIIPKKVLSTAQPHFVRLQLANRIPESVQRLSGTEVRERVRDLAGGEAAEGNEIASEAAVCVNDARGTLNYKWHMRMASSAESKSIGCDFGLRAGLRSLAAAVAWTRAQPLAMDTASDEAVDWTAGDIHAIISTSRITIKYTSNQPAPKGIMPK